MPVNVMAGIRETSITMHSVPFLVFYSVDWPRKIRKVQTTENPIHSKEFTLEITAYANANAVRAIANANHDRGSNGAKYGFDFAPVDSWAGARIISGGAWRPRITSPSSGRSP